jgi:GAF domain-containing protein
MRRVVEQTLALIAVADGAVVEMAGEGHLTYVCAGGSLAEHVGTRLGLGESLSGLAVRTGEALRCENSASDPRVDGEACQRVGALSMVCVPLRRAAEPIGVLKVSAGRPHSSTASRS